MEIDMMRIDPGTIGFTSGFSQEHKYSTVGEQITVFCLFQCFVEKEYQTESKRNETFGNVIFSSDKIQETWTLLQEVPEAVMRAGGTPPTGRAPLPRGPLGAPPTYSFLLYIRTYPQTIRT